MFSPRSSVPEMWYMGSGSRGCLMLLPLRDGVMAASHILGGVRDPSSLLELYWPPGFNPRSPCPEPGPVHPFLGITWATWHLSQVLPSSPTTAASSGAPSIPDRNPSSEFPRSPSQTAPHQCCPMADPALSSLVSVTVATRSRQAQSLSVLVFSLQQSPKDLHK